MKKFYVNTCKSPCSSIQFEIKQINDAAGFDGRKKITYLSNNLKNIRHSTTNHEIISNIKITRIVGRMRSSTLSELWCTLHLGRYFQVCGIDKDTARGKNIITIDIRRSNYLLLT